MWTAVWTVASALRMWMRNICLWCRAMQNITQEVMPDRIIRDITDDIITDIPDDIISPAERMYMNKVYPETIIKAESYFGTQLQVETKRK